MGSSTLRRRILRPLATGPKRAMTALIVAAALVPVGTIVHLREVLAQSALQNGVVLPPNFLQPTAPTLAFRQPTYLQSPPAVVPINQGRQLFVDDFLIQDTNLQRTPHRPVFYSGNPVLTVGSGRDFNSLAFPYSDGVWFDPETNLFEMWYDGGYGNNIAYAYSSDGKNWVKPNIADAATPGSNLVLTIGGGRDSDTVWRDASDPDPSRRYKAFALFNIPQINIYYSADGIHWSAPQPNNMNSLSDRTTVFYNPFRMSGWKARACLPDFRARRTGRRTKRVCGITRRATTWSTGPIRRTYSGQVPTS